MTDRNTNPPDTDTDDPPASFAPRRASSSSRSRPRRAQPSKVPSPGLTVSFEGEGAVFAGGRGRHRRPGHDTVLITDDVVAKAPKPPAQSMFFVTDKGELTRHDPRQTSLLGDEDRDDRGGRR